LREKNHDNALTQYQRGGGDPQIRLLQTTAHQDTPDIIFLQETLVDGTKVRTFLNKFCPNWHTCTASSSGTSGGLAVSWDPTKFTLVPYLCCGGILLTGTSLWNDQSITLLNMYGPCSDIKLFWDKVAASGLLDHTNLIVVGDLNFTTNVGEVWGSSTSLDPLAGYFGTLLQDHHLVDFLPDDIVPTWRNGRSGWKLFLKDWIGFYSQKT
jgi:hypothetical protein